MKVPIDEYRAIAKLQEKVSGRDAPYSDSSVGADGGLRGTRRTPICQERNRSI